MCKGVMAPKGTIATHKRTMMDTNTKRLFQKKHQLIDEVEFNKNSIIIEIVKLSLKVCEREKKKERKIH
jgi:hypothetical protein